MAVYKVRDDLSGKTVEFDWADPTPPTDADFDQIFQEARGEDQRPLGFVAKSQESGGRGGATIGNTAGDYGGKSYGEYQLASKGPKTLQSFLAESGYQSQFKAVPGTPSFDAEWQNLGNDEQFNRAQYDYIVRNNYQPVVDFVRQKYGFDPEQSVAVRELLFSTANHYGPGGASKVISEALDSYTGDQISEKDLIDLLTEHKKNTTDRFFKSSSFDVQEAQKARYDRERGIYYGLLEDQGQPEVPPEAPEPSTPPLPMPEVPGEKRMAEGPAPAAEPTAEDDATKYGLEPFAEMPASTTEVGVGEPKERLALKGRQAELTTGIPTREQTPEEEQATSMAWLKKEIKKNAPKFPQTVVGAIAEGVGDALTLGLIETPESQAAQVTQPLAFTAGQVAATVAQAYGGGSAVAKGIAKIPALARSPIAQAALSRVITNVGVSGARAAADVATEKKEFGDALKDVAQAAGASLVSLIPEVAAPPNAWQMLWQPLADLVYDVGVGTIRGQDVGSADWWKSEALNLAISEGMAIKDVKSGEAFKASQGDQRAELKRWLKGRGEVGIERVSPTEAVEATNPRYFAPGAEERLQAMKEGTERTAEERAALLSPRQTKTIPAVEGAETRGEFEDVVPSKKIPTVDEQIAKMAEATDISNVPKVEQDRLRPIAERLVREKEAAYEAPQSLANKATVAKRPPPTEEELARLPGEVFKEQKAELVKPFETELLTETTKSGRLQGEEAPRGQAVTPPTRVPSPEGDAEAGKLAPEPEQGAKPKGRSRRGRKGPVQPDQEPQPVRAEEGKGPGAEPPRRYVYGDTSPEAESRIVETTADGLKAAVPPEGEADAAARIEEIKTQEAEGAKETGAAARKAGGKEGPEGEAEGRVRLRDTAEDRVEAEPGAGDRGDVVEFDNTILRRRFGTYRIPYDFTRAGRELSDPEKYRALKDVQKKHEELAANEKLPAATRRANKAIARSIVQMAKPYSQAGEVKGARESAQVDRYVKDAETKTVAQKEIQDKVGYVMRNTDVDDIHGFLGEQFTRQQVEEARAMIEKGEKDGEAAEAIRQRVSEYLFGGTDPRDVVSQVKNEAEINFERAGMQEEPAATEGPSEAPESTLAARAPEARPEPGVTAREGAEAGQKISEETGDLFGRTSGEQRIAEEQARRTEQRRGKQRQNPLEGTMFDAEEMESRATTQEDLFDTLNRISKNADRAVEEQARVGQAGAVALPGGLRAEPEVDAVPKDVNQVARARMRAARGAPQERLLQKMARWADRAKRSLTRQHPELDPVKDAPVNEILRQSDASTTKTAIVVNGVLRGMTTEMRGNDIELFEGTIVLRDLARTLDKDPELFEGRGELWYGYKNADEVRDDLAKYEGAARKNKRVAAALNERKAMQQNLAKQLVENKLQPKAILDDPEAYWHRQVLEYMDAKEAAEAIPTQGIPGTGAKKSYRKRRTPGAVKDFNTKYIESEHEYLTHALQDLENVKTINRIDAEVGVGKQVDADYAKALEEEYVRLGGDLEELQQEMVDSRTPGPAYPYVLKNRINDIDETALTKAGLTNHDRFIPEGYEEMPIEGTKFRNVSAVPEAAIDDMLDQWGSATVTRDMLKDMMVVSRGKSIVIPSNVATTLKQISQGRAQSMPAKVARGIMNVWKWEKLYGPTHFAKFFVNNFLGDADAAFGAYPGIFKEYKRVIKEIHAIKQGKAPSKEILDAVGKGVIGSGYAHQEVVDVSTRDFYSAMLARKGQIGKILRNPIAGYVDGVTRINELREDSLRLAAYRYVLKELKAGKDLYGASNPGALKALKESKTMTIEDRAAKISREILGDYGAITETGDWMRTYAAPFWSWMEINAKRYYRLFTNAPLEGAGAAKRMGKTLPHIVAAGGVKLGTRTAQIAAFMMAVEAYNRLVANKKFPGVYDDMDEDTRQMRIILYRDKDGNVYTLRAQGAFSDVLGWAGLQNASNDVEGLIKGEKSWKDLGKLAANEAVNKFLGSIGPQYKWIGEIATKKRFYPDIMKPRAIRNIPEYVAKQIGVDPVYRWLAAIPSRGWEDELMNLVIYKQNSGEAAYFETFRLVDKWKEANGRTAFQGYTPTQKGNALYYYKKGIRVGNRRSARKWYDEYARLGGTAGGIQKSIESAAPLASLSVTDRNAFNKSLSAEDARTVNKAFDWYEKIYKSKER